MIYFILFYTFLKLGLFGFGGGYAIIPLLEVELQTHQWMESSEFLNIVSISQMTPGPIAINAATYIGYQVSSIGILGSLVATIGIVSPSFIFVILVAKMFMKLKEDPYFNGVLKGIRPVTIGLIISAVWFLAKASIFTFENNSGQFSGGGYIPLYQWFRQFHISFGALCIAGIILVGRVRFKIHPIIAVGLSAILGILLI